MNLVFLQPRLVIGGTSSSVSVVSQPVQSGGGTDQSYGVCTDRHRINTAEATAAHNTVNASG